MNREKLINWGKLASAILALVAIIGAVYTLGVPAAREVFAPKSDPPPYASIERVNALAVVELKNTLDMLIEQNTEETAHAREDTLMGLRSQIRDERRRWCLALAADPPQPISAYQDNVEMDTDTYFSMTGQEFLIPPCSDFTR